MSEGLRILLAGPLGHVVAGPLQSAFDDVTVIVAADEDEVVRSVAGRVRFDVVIADVIWNRPEMEWTFDGLDVINVLATHDRLAPVLLAAQGHSMEADHLDEGRLRDEVWGVFPKSAGLMPLVSAIRTVALGQKPAEQRQSDYLRGTEPRRPPVYELFTGQRGHTSGRLAGAIASGSATDNSSLARVAKVAPNTANKMTSHYLGPIISRRGEHDEQLPMTQAAVYRWCGLHARYLVSWCRRNGHADVLGTLRS